MYLQECGNTVSSTIPIALKQAADEGKLKPRANGHAGRLRSWILVGCGVAGMAFPFLASGILTSSRWSLYDANSGAR